MNHGIEAFSYGALASQHLITRHLGIAAFNYTASWHRKNGLLVTGPSLSPMAVQHVSTLTCGVVWAWSMHSLMSLGRLPRPDALVGQYV